MNRSILYRVRRRFQVLAVKVFGDVIMSKVFFRIVLKQRLNLNNPRTFNEKIQWYKINYCKNNSSVINCSDKVKVREYLMNKGYEKNLIELIGIWNSEKEINWSELPQKFAIKCNHGCGYNIICSDKDKLNEKKTKKTLKKWLNEDFGFFNGEMHYNKINKKIICEKYLEPENGYLPIDYKIHCFNGKPKFVLVCSDRTNSESKYNYYNMEWNKLEYSLVENSDYKFEKPYSYDEMIKISEEIAKDFPFVRVDFYQYKDKAYIGELTFVPAGGLDDTLPPSVDYEIGDLFNIDGIGV